MIIKQISTFLENTAGRLADVTSALAAHHINLRAITIADTTDFGILRMVVDQPEKAVATLREAGFTARETPVLAVEIADTPGEIARITALFRHHAVSIEYIYACLEHSAGKAVIIFKVNDINAGQRLLEQHHLPAQAGFCKHVSAKIAT